MLRANDLLLFQGDSITNAFRRPDEINDAYRLGAGYALMVAARLMAEGHPRGLQAANRGVSGDRVRDMRARWDADAVALAPNVISILVGTNDANAAGRGEADSGVEVFVRDYDALLEYTRSSLPDTSLVLLEPFMLPVDIAFPATLVHLAQMQRAVGDLARRHHALFIPMQEAMTSAAGDRPELWMYDGIHPTARGHWLMAQRWLDAVKVQPFSMEHDV